MDPDPDLGGPKTYGSGGSGSATLMLTLYSSLLGDGWNYKKNRLSKIYASFWTLCHKLRYEDIFCFCMQVYMIPPPFCLAIIWIFFTVPWQLLKLRYRIWYTGIYFVANPRILKIHHAAWTFTFFVHFFGGLECVGHSFVYVTYFFYFWEMPGFEPIELP